MTTPVEVIGPTTEVAAAAERMLARHLRGMPVAEEGFLIGMVCRRDLLRMLVRDDDVVMAATSPTTRRKRSSSRWRKRSPG